MLWNRPGHLSFIDGSLSAQLPERSVRVYSTAEHAPDPYVETMTPHLAILLEGTVGLSTGRARSVEEIRAILDARAGGDGVSIHRNIFSRLPVADVNRRVQA